MNQSGWPGSALFLNKENELRSGWRAAVFYLLFFLTGMIPFLIVSVMNMLLLHKGAQDFQSEKVSFYGPLTDGIISWSVLLFAVLISTAICVKFLEKRSIGSAGFNLHRGWIRDLGLGLALGTVSILIAISIGILASGQSIHFQPRPVWSHIFFVFILYIFFLIAAAYEELFFRGFAFQAFIHNLGPTAAITITSLAFGIAHLFNPQASALSTINTILAGVWLGVAYLVTRSLWLATGLHVSWNFVMGGIFGLPVSGSTTYNQYSILLTGTSGPEWITGASYGPEGGVVTTIALLFSMVVIWKSGLFRTTEEMLASIKHGSKRDEAYPGTRWLS